MRDEPSAYCARVCGLFGVALFFGCDANPRYFAPLDSPAESRAIVLATTDANSAVLDVLAEPNASGALNLLASREVELLHLFHYGQDLEALGLSPGRLGAEGRCRRDCALANPIARSSLEWVGEGFESIEPASVEHEHILEFLLPDRASWCSPPCRRLTSDVLPLGTNELIKGALPTPDGRVWLLHQDGSTRLIAADGEVTTGCRIEMEDWTELSVARDGGGRFWIAMALGPTLIAIDGRALDGAGACAIIHQSPTPPLYYGVTLAAAEDDDPSVELFALGTEQRALLRYDGVAWTQIGQGLEPPLPGFEDDSPGGVLWLGRGRGLGFQGSQEVIVSDGAESRSIQVPRNGGSGRIVAARHTGDGTALLSVEGAGLVRATRPYTDWRLETPVPVFVVWSFVPWHDWVLTSSKGALTLRRRSGEVCDAAPYPNVGITPELFPLGDERTFLMPRFSSVRAGQGEVQDEQRALVVRILEPCE